MIRSTLLVRYGSSSILPAPPFGERGVCSGRISKRNLPSNRGRQFAHPHGLKAPANTTLYLKSWCRFIDSFSLIVSPWLEGRATAVTLTLMRVLRGIVLERDSFNEKAGPSRHMRWTGLVVVHRYAAKYIVLPLRFTSRRDLSFEP